MLALLGDPIVAGADASPVLFPAVLGLLPRGDVYFFSSIKIAVFVILYLIWVRFIAWVDADSEAIGLPRENWNLLMIGALAAGLVTPFLIPSFGIALLLSLLFAASSGLVYVSQRNQKVPPQLRVFTGDHMWNFLKSMLSGSDKPEKKPSVKADVASDGEDGEIPIRFLSRGKGGELEEVRIGQTGSLKAAVELIWEALQARATDIHLEPTRDEMSVRLRVDGILQAATSFTRQRGEAIVNVFKNLAGLDITEKRKPQDGSFTSEVDKRNVDFRVATAGSVNGEKMVMRILDSGRQMKGLAHLGLREALREKIEEIVQQAHGMVITCGPTGAGKTSTLYACLKEIDRFQRNVITLENPVEYHLENITQIEVNERAEKTFAGELRSILRQDPDVILIGEIRDAETAEIACQAAQTGHMVLSTLHANDAVTALTRLLDLGVKPFLIAGALSAVLSQRLIRLLCPKCKVAYKPPSELLAKYRIPAEKVKQIFRAAEEDDRPRDKKGDSIVCEHCSGAGYLGRTGIFELLILNDEIRTLLRQPALDVTALKQAAQKSGTSSLYEDGLRKVLEGKTSLAELQRVAK